RSRACSASIALASAWVRLSCSCFSSARISSRTRASAPRAATSAEVAPSSSSDTRRSAASRRSWASASAPSTAMARRSASSARRLRLLDRALLSLLCDLDRLVRLAPGALRRDPCAGGRVPRLRLSGPKLVDQRRGLRTEALRGPAGLVDLGADLIRIEGQEGLL